MNILFLVICFVDCEHGGLFWSIDRNKEKNKKINGSLVMKRRRKERRNKQIHQNIILEDNIVRKMNKIVENFQI